MNDFESRLSTALREEAEEFSMNVDVQSGASELEARLDSADRSKRTTYGLWALAAAVVVALLVIGYGLLAPKPSSQPVVPPTRDFTSTQFALPFSADLPAWVRTQSDSTPSDKAEWVTWNRCPDNLTECIGLSFNRNAFLLKGNEFKPTTYAEYVAYLDSLGKSGAVTITARSTQVVGGRAATVMSLMPLRDVAAGAGCHVDTTCEDFLQGVQTRIAVVDTASIDPDREFLVIWTRAGAVAAPEAAWLSDFDATLASLTFQGPTPSSG